MRNNYNMALKGMVAAGFIVINSYQCFHASTSDMELRMFHDCDDSSPFHIDTELSRTRLVDKASDAPKGTAESNFSTCLNYLVAS